MATDGKNLTEIENLSQAVNDLAPIIESLKHDDYILPIVIPFISAFLGALGAYAVAQRLETNKRTNEMIAAANTLIVTADDCFSNLLGLKRNYYPHLTSDPIQRMLLSIVLLGFPPVDLDFSGLAFISEKCKPPDKDDTNRGFGNISKISSMFRNYNFLVAKWGKRNELVRNVTEKSNPITKDKGVLEKFQRKSF